MISERISNDIPPQMKNFEYGYPYSNALLQFRLKFERCKLHMAARHPTKCDVTNDVKQFPTVYHRIYCRKFLMLSNQTSRYKMKCIRNLNDCCTLTLDPDLHARVYKGRASDSKVRKGAKNGNQYNQLPHLNPGTTWKSEKSRIKHLSRRLALSQPADDHTAAIYRCENITNTRHK